MEFDVAAPSSEVLSPSDSSPYHLGEYLPRTPLGRGFDLYLDSKI